MYQAHSWGEVSSRSPCIAILNWIFGFSSFSNDKVNYINWFSNVEQSYIPRKNISLSWCISFLHIAMFVMVMTYFWGFFSVFMRDYWPVVLFSWDIFICLWYQNNAGFITWVGKYFYSVLCKSLCGIDMKNFLKCLVDLPIRSAGSSLFSKELQI